MNPSTIFTLLSFVLLMATPALGTDANRELFQTQANEYMDQDPCWTSHYHCGKDDVTYMCGRQANGASCPNNLCCSEYGWCGSTLAYCGGGCQSGPCRDDVKERYNHNYCGSSWEMANDQCYKQCPHGLDSECDGDDRCYADATNCPPCLEPSEKTLDPTLEPTLSPSLSPTLSPSTKPTKRPTRRPVTPEPSNRPTRRPVTLEPTLSPSVSPTFSPTLYPEPEPTRRPTKYPSSSPTRRPTRRPTNFPEIVITLEPTLSPSESPTVSPSVSPTVSPTLSPSLDPTLTPTLSPIKTFGPTDIGEIPITKKPSRKPTRKPHYPWGGSKPSRKPTRKPVHHWASSTSRSSAKSSKNSKSSSGKSSKSSSSSGKSSKSSSSDQDLWGGSRGGSLPSKATALAVQKVASNSSSFKRTSIITCLAVVCIQSYAM